MYTFACAGMGIAPPENGIDCDNPKEFHEILSVCFVILVLLFSVL